MVLLIAFWTLLRAVFFIRAREKHAVYFNVTLSFDHIVFSIEILFKDE